MNMTAAVYSDSTVVVANQRILIECKKKKARVIRKGISKFVDSS